MSLFFLPLAETTNYILSSLGLVRARILFVEIVGDDGSVGVCTLVSRLLLLNM